MSYYVLPTEAPPPAPVISAVLVADDADSWSTYRRVIRVQEILNHRGFHVRHWDDGETGMTAVAGTINGRRYLAAMFEPEMEE